MKNVWPTKERIKTHFTYTWWAYVLSAILLIGAWDLCYSWTEYRAPAEKSVYVNYAGAYVSEETRLSIQNELRDAIPVDEIEYIEVNAFPIDYTDTEHLSAALEKLMVMIATGEGDVYMIDRSTFKQYAEMGAFASLDAYVAPDDCLGDLFTEEQIASGTTATEEDGTHCYALPCDTFYKYYEIGIDPSNYMIAIMSMTSNPEGSLKVMQEMIRYGMDAERPAYLDDKTPSEQDIQEEASQIAPIG